MAGSATRYTGGITTTPYRDVLGALPILPTPTQYIFGNQDFAPYLATQWTTTQVNGTAAPFAWNTGVVRLSTTGTTNADAVYLTGLMQGNQFHAANRNWFSVDIATTTSSMTDITIRAGYTDTVNPASAANGCYSGVKASWKWTCELNLQIIKGGTTTTISNVADLSIPIPYSWVEQRQFAR